MPVLAAAAGEVVSARYGEADGAYLALGRGAVEKRECGNGVMIKHGRWRTQYCHMRNGSVAVKPGQKVAQGQTLGLIGLSGKTEFPHLHLTVRRFGLAVDPFTGKTLGGGCTGGEAAAPLWQPKAAIAYRETAIYAAGIAARPPRAEEIKADVSLPQARAGGKPIWSAGRRPSASPPACAFRWSLRRPTAPSSPAVTMKPLGRRPGVFPPPDVASPRAAGRPDSTGSPRR